MRKKAGESKLKKPYMLLATLWLAPALLWLALFLSSQLLENVATTGAATETVRVGQRETMQKQAVNVAIQRGEAIKLRLHQGLEQGATVTAIMLTPGEPVALGKAVLRINEQPVFAYTSPTPFYRQLTQTDTGADVALLQTFLHNSGYGPAASNTTASFDAALTENLKRFQKDNGLEATGTFDPANFIYVPQGFGKITELKVSIGAVTPADGIAALGEGSILNITLQERKQDQSKNVQLPENENLILQQNGDESKQTQINAQTLQTENAVSLENSLKEWGTEVQTTENETIYNDLLLINTKSMQVGTAPTTAVTTTPNNDNCIILVNKNGKTRAVHTNIHQIPGELATIGINPEFIGKKILLEAARTTPNRCAPK